MDTRFYFKELPNQPIYLSTGQPLKFDFMATEDAWLISELDAAAQQRIGGILRITKEDYEEGLKKKQLAQLQNNSRNYRPELSALQLHQPQPKRDFPGTVRVAVAGKPHTGPLPEPLQIPDPSTFVMPKLGKPPVAS